MTRSIFIFLMALTLGGTSSCTKSTNASAAPNLTGQWEWISTDFDTLSPGNSGLHKVLNIQADGLISITHNDTLNIYDMLQVVPGPISANRTDQWQMIVNTGSDLCMVADLPGLLVNKTSFHQYKLTPDTLFIVNGCVGTGTSVYIRQN
jgi:hypothetical protein